MTSCTANTLITVHHDGSAIVNLDRDFDKADIKRYYDSEIISEIDTTTGRVTFSITHIDSLGNYLPFHPQGFIQFKTTENELTITDGNTTPFKDDLWYCCHQHMVIEFEKKILDVDSESRNSKKIDDRKVQIRKSRKQLLKGSQTELRIKIDSSIIN